jgi:hypothetical protein
MLEPKHMSWARAVTAAAARLPTRRCSPPYFSPFFLAIFNSSHVQYVIFRIGRARPGGAEEGR